jgi:hypothetical protein
MLSVRTVALDRTVEEKAGTFGTSIRDLKPGVVIDMICFTLASARHLSKALRGQLQHFLHTGTIWVHGPSVVVPTTETQPRTPTGECGIQKAEIEAYLIEAARQHGFPATVVHPGHIVGLGWAPVNLAGNFNPQVFSTLAQGRELALPNFGMETVHHIHADDVAQMFMKAIANWSASVSEAFRTVSPAAVTLRLRRDDGSLVRAGGETDVSAVAGVEGAREPGGRCGDPRAHRLQPEQQHRQGAAAARLRASLLLVRGGAGRRAVAR